MAWVESHQEMERHPKTLRMMLLLGWDVDRTIGFLHRFWWWALDGAPDGVVTDMCRPGMCGAAFGYDADLGDRVIAAAIEADWLDRSPEGEVTIHNHDRYRGRLSEIREEARQRQQRRRNRLREQDSADSHDEITESSQEVTEASRDCHADVTTTQQNPNSNKTLNPTAQGEKKQKALKGGVGENEAPPTGSRAPPGFSNSLDSGLRAEGDTALSETLPCGGFSCQDVFEAFRRLFAAHSLFSRPDFSKKVEHCNVTPALWAMLYLDKIHYLYKQDKNGKTVLDYEDADPVAMTVSGFLPSGGREKHSPTDSARQLFAEIMQDHAKMKLGQKAHWNGNLSGPAVALELGRRKGKGRR